jgi:hypothetical protein
MSKTKIVVAVEVLDAAAFNVAKGAVIVILSARPLILVAGNIVGGADVVVVLSTAAASRLLILIAGDIVWRADVVVVLSAAAASRLLILIAGDIVGRADVVVVLSVAAAPRLLILVAGNIVGRADVVRATPRKGNQCGIVVGQSSFLTASRRRSENRQKYFNFWSETSSRRRTGLKTDEILSKRSITTAATFFKLNLVQLLSLICTKTKTLSNSLKRPLMALGPIATEPSL